MKLFKIDFSFIITILLIIFSPFQKYIIALLIALMIHEFGHIILAIIFKIKIYSIRLTAFGLFMDAEVVGLVFIKELLFYSSGILVGIIFSFIFKGIYCDMNKYIILVNLIPIYPFDGYQILKSIISYFNKYLATLYFCSLFGIIVALALVFLSFFTNTYILIGNLVYGLLLNILELRKTRYIYESFLLYRYLNETSFNKKYVKLSKVIWKCLYKYHNIYTYLGKNKINEDEILDLHYRP